MQELIERLKAIKLEQEKLLIEQSEIVTKLDDLTCYQNSDGTWTRCRKIDAAKELMENGKYLDMGYVYRYFPKVEVLKNKPKEME